MAKLTTLQELQKLQKMMKATDTAEKSFTSAWNKYIMYDEIAHKREDEYLKKRYAEEEYAKKLQEKGILRYMTGYRKPLDRNKR